MAIAHQCITTLEKIMDGQTHHLREVNKRVINYEEEFGRIKHPIPMVLSYMRKKNIRGKH